MSVSVLQEVHLQHVEGAVDVGGLPENQRRQATRKLHAAMASCLEGGGGRGSFKRQAELEKAFAEKARQEPRQPGKTEGQLPAPPFACAAASWHVSTPEREEPNQPPDSPTPAALGPGAPLSSPKPL